MTQRILFTKEVEELEEAMGECIYFWECHLTIWKMEIMVACISCIGFLKED